MSARNSSQKRRLKERLLRGRLKAKCAGCKRVFPAGLLTIDHICPLSEGGSWKLKNLQLMCRDCNEEKSNDWDGKTGHKNYKPKY